MALNSTSVVSNTTGVYRCMNHSIYTVCGDIHISYRENNTFEHILTSTIREMSVLHKTFEILKLFTFFRLDSERKRDMEYSIENSVMQQPPSLQHGRGMCSREATSLMCTSQKFPRTANSTIIKLRAAPSFIKRTMGTALSNL